jgi:hypothetical protein
MRTRTLSLLALIVLAAGCQAVTAPNGVYAPTQAAIRPVSDSGLARPTPHGKQTVDPGRPRL